MTGRIGIGRKSSPLQGGALAIGWSQRHAQAFVGYALSDKPLPKATQERVSDELLRMALRPTDGGSDALKAR